VGKLYRRNYRDERYEWIQRKTKAPRIVNNMRYAVGGNGKAVEVEVEGEGLWENYFALTKW
jgi:hypothetical protein